MPTVSVVFRKKLVDTAPFYFLMALKQVYIRPVLLISCSLIMTNMQFFWLNAQIFHLLSGHALDATLSATIKTKIVTNVLPQLKHPAWLGTRYVAGFYLYDVLHRLGFLFFFTNNQVLCFIPYPNVKWLIIVVAFVVLSDKEHVYSSPDGMPVHRRAPLLSPPPSLARTFFRFPLKFTSTHFYS